MPIAAFPLIAGQKTIRANQARILANQARILRAR
jgi:hypothetical protein